ncbi:hypothetical protein INT45_010577 [Circinella minor]|uniref:Uncharacterized protein n=1 Tax=Circinella minor TaxID=1195481 RepID=A0A8H7RR13_9FUNG|nr:hypothetical protein INT45_010577 [Circinella minor]
MSTRAEKFIHQTENTEHRHKIDYTTSLYDAWIADQSKENMMDLDENVNAAETEPVMLGSMLGPDEGDMDDFDDYDFGDQEPPVIVDLSNNQEDTTETDDNDDFMDEEPVSTFDKLYMFIGLFIILFQRQYLSEVAAEILMAFINIILSYTNTSCPKLPKKLSILRQHMGVDIFEEGLKRYVACKKCHKIYTLDVLLANEQTLCHHTEFPHHPSSAWSAKLCNEQLFKNGSCKKNQQLKEYPYHSVIKGLQLMFRRPNFYEQINAWRFRQQNDSIYYEIYDGKIWNEIKDDVGETFINDERSIQFALNVDW